jgi:hypothetical protein
MQITEEEFARYENAKNFKKITLWEIDKMSIEAKLSEEKVRYIVFNYLDIKNYIQKLGRDTRNPLIQKRA